MSALGRKLGRCCRCLPFQSPRGVSPRGVSPVTEGGWVRLFRTAAKSARKDSRPWYARATPLTPLQLHAAAFVEANCPIIADFACSGSGDDLDGLGLHYYVSLESEVQVAGLTFARNPSDDVFVGFKFNGGGIVLADPDAEHPPCITAVPTLAPTTQPSTMAPTESGETFAPTNAPTTPVPTPMPTPAPTDTPTTSGPTGTPTAAPATTAPTRSGETFSPSPDPLTSSPSTPPTTTPSQQPTSTPTRVGAVNAGASGAADDGGSDAGSIAGIVVALLVVIVILAIVVVKRQRRQPRGAEGDKDEEAVAATELENISAGIAVPATPAATSGTTTQGNEDSGKPLGEKNYFLASAPEVSDYALASSSAPAVNDYALASSTAPVVSDYALASSTAPAEHLYESTDDYSLGAASDDHTYEATDNLDAPLSKAPSLTLDDDDHLRFMSVYRSNPLADGNPAARPSMLRQMTFREDEGMMEDDALPATIRRRSTSYGSAVASPEAADDVAPLGAEGESKPWSFAGSIGRFSKRVSRSGGKDIKSPPNIKAPTRRGPISLEPDNGDGPVDAGYVPHGTGDDMPAVDEDAEWNDINQFLGAVGDDAVDTDPKQELQRRASKISLV